MIRNICMLIVSILGTICSVLIYIVRSLPKACEQARYKAEEIERAAMAANEKQKGHPRDETSN